MDVSLPLSHSCTPSQYNMWWELNAFYLNTAYNISFLQRQHFLYVLYLQISHLLFYSYSCPYIYIGIHPCICVFMCIHVCKCMATSELNTRCLLKPSLPDFLRQSLLLNLKLMFKTSLPDQWALEPAWSVSSGACLVSELWRSICFYFLRAKITDMITGPDF